MRILKAWAQNFGSFRQLEFEPEKRGLVLVNGPTGAGKSTLCDLVPWVLFGITAKNGNADEVLSWHGGVTAGAVSFEGFTVERKRGRNAKDNDLLVIRNGEERGKDSTDTQKLINRLVGMDAETYLAGAYFTEFSPTASFFHTTPKNRRALCERLVDLRLATKLQASAKEEISQVKEDHRNLVKEVEIAERRIQFLDGEVAANQERATDWDKRQGKRIEDLARSAGRFEDDKALRAQKLEALIDELMKDLKPYESLGFDYAKVKEKLKHLGDDHRCDKCGQKLASDERQKWTERLMGLNEQQSQVRTIEAKIMTLTYQLETVQRERNTPEAQLRELADQENPFIAAIRDCKAKRKDVKTRLTHFREAEQVKAQELTDAELLRDLIADFRSELVKNTIVHLESKTNQLLTDFFDAEIRVTFDVQDADKLEVAVTKDGHQCVYSQLSKGQRQLLKLCFGLAVMDQVSNHHGIDFNTIMLDECTDGLDESSKVRAFKMLTSLEAKYDSIFLVDHSETLRTLATSQIVVSLTNGESSIETGAA